MTITVGQFIVIMVISAIIGNYMIYYHFRGNIFKHRSERYKDFWYDITMSTIVVSIIIYIFWNIPIN